MCMCVYVHVHVCVHARTHAHMQWHGCREQRTTLSSPSTLFVVFLLHILEMDSLASVSLGLHKPVLFIPLYVGAGDLNTGPHACAATTSTPSHFPSSPDVGYFYGLVWFLLLVTFMEVFLFVFKLNCYFMTDL